MSKHYVVFDQTGKLLHYGSTQDEVFHLVDVAPTDILQELDVPINSVNYYFKDGYIAELPLSPGNWAEFDIGTETWIEKTSPADLALKKVEGLYAINRVAGEVRGTWVTISPGQDGVYLQKKAEALAYLAEVPEPTDLSAYPFIANEIGVTAITANQLAQIWVNLSVMWSQVAAQIEHIRIRGITYVEDSSSVFAITAELEAIEANLRSLKYGNAAP